MATSDAQICNLALARIGHSRFIDSLEEPTAEARTCRVLYAQARDALLQAHAWTFARRRAPLVRLPGFERTGWSYAYALPRDCLVPRSIWPGMRAPRVDQLVPFALEEGADQRILLTDHAAPELEYTAAVDKPPLFSPLFVEVLAWALASELSMAMAVKEGVEARARQHYQLALSRAIAADLQQGQADLEPESAYIAGRY